jgi:hypothetical protein
MIVMSIADGVEDRITNYLLVSETRYIKGQLISLDINITTQEFNMGVFVRLTT